MGAKDQVVKERVVSSGTEVDEKYGPLMIIKRRQ